MLPGIKKIFGLQTVPFSNERNKLEPFAAKRIRPKTPEVFEPLMRAVDAFDAAQNTGELSPEQLDALVAAVSSSRRPLYENICGYVRILSRKWPEMRKAILGMSRDKQSHVRFNAVLCLDQSAPSEFVDGILRAALLDKSAKVRQKAADWIGRLDRKTLTSDLEASLANEEHEATRRTMIAEFQRINTKRVS